LASHDDIINIKQNKSENVIACTCVVKFAKTNENHASSCETDANIDNVRDAGIKDRSFSIITIRVHIVFKRHFDSSIDRKRTFPSCY
jgi:hypothetical protein